MECGHICEIDRPKRQADRTLLFEYILLSVSTSKTISGIDDI